MSSSLIYSTIEFHALPPGALFLYPQPCHQLPVFEHVAELFFFRVAVMEKDDFPKKRPKWAPFFSVFSVWRTESSPALNTQKVSHKTVETTARTTCVM